MGGQAQPAGVRTCELPPRLRLRPVTCDSDGPRSPAGAPTVLAESRDATAAGLENPATRRITQASGTASGVRSHLYISLAGHFRDSTSGHGTRLSRGSRSWTDRRKVPHGCCRMRGLASWGSGSFQNRIRRRHDAARSQLVAEHRPRPSISIIASGALPVMLTLESAPTQPKCSKLAASCPEGARQQRSVASRMPKV